MAIRGIYSEPEKAMIADFQKKAESMRGWNKMLNVRVASEKSIRDMATVVDCWNPLWNDENYANNTRWGGLIAPPLYQFCVGATVFWPMLPPEGGYLDHWYIGENWELFQPVHINDSFKVWRRLPQLIDITEPSGKGLRKFTYIVQDYSVFNQRDELVNNYKVLLELIILPEPPILQKIKPLADYSYTQTELEYIESVEKQEKIRGAETRYWEDVQIGEETAPVSAGPTTVWDMITFFSGIQELPLFPSREMRKRAPSLFFFVDPDTGVSHADVEWHFINNFAMHRGQRHAFHFGNFARQTMARLVSNWMGDDGFIRSYKWRHFSRTAIGDSLTGYGKVINKYVQNGEYLVDLEVYLENLRGNITEAAVATVSLFSKDTINPQIKYSQGGNNV